MRKPKVRELVEAVKAVIKGPYTAKFPAAPYVPPDAFRGLPRYHEEDCVGCGACAQVCPASAIVVLDDVESDPPMRRLELRYDNCIFCGQCELNCTTKEGIKQSGEYDLATLDRSECVESVEKELILCEMCDEIVGAKEHLKWISRKIGPKAYASPTLIMATDGDLASSAGLAEGGSKRPDAPARRADMMRILCPRCRREVILREMWG